jgi:hypothetical protein
MLYPKQLYPLLIMFAFFCLGGSCDHTVLSGKILIPDDNIISGEEVAMELVVPPHLAEIQRLMWEVEPRSLGSFSGEGKGRERKVIFKAKATGSGTVSVSGFFKQTNPQPIASTAINIQEPGQ